LLGLIGVDRQRLRLGPHREAADGITGSGRSDRDRNFCGSGDRAVLDAVRKRRFPIAGGGADVWSFIHFDDAAAATVLALDHGPPGVDNIVDDDPAPVSEWLPALARAGGAGCSR
jgi:nucleoside-diphosphate-sugar epimerase